MYVHSRASRYVSAYHVARGPEGMGEWGGARLQRTQQCESRAVYPVSSAKSLKIS